MRVIQSSNFDEIEVTCTGKGNGNKGCGAILGVLREDMRYYGGSSGGYIDREPEVMIRCPECGTRTDLVRKDWPRDASSLTEYSSHWASTGQDPKPNNDTVRSYITKIT